MPPGAGKGDEGASTLLQRHRATAAPRNVPEQSPALSLGRQGHAGGHSRGVGEAPTPLGHPPAAFPWPAPAHPAQQSSLGVPRVPHGQAHSAASSPLSHLSPPRLPPVCSAPGSLDGIHIWIPVTCCERNTSLAKQLWQRQLGCTLRTELCRQLRQEPSARLRCRGEERGAVLLT